MFYYITTTPSPNVIFRKNTGLWKKWLQTKSHGTYYFPSLFPNRLISLQKSQRLKHKKFSAKYNLKHNHHSSFQGGKEGAKLYHCTRPLLWPDSAPIFLLKGIDTNILPHANFKMIFKNRTFVVTGLLLCLISSKTPRPQTAKNGYIHGMDYG